MNARAESQGKARPGKNGKPTRAGYAAIFIDYENVYYHLKTTFADIPELSDFVVDMLMNLQQRLLDRFQVQTIIAKAYADYERIRSTPQGSLYLMGVETVNVMGTNHKNAADMKLCIDAMEIMYTRAEIETYVIFAGDRDYIPIVQHLKKQAKTVISVGFKGNFSGDLLLNVGRQNFIDAYDLIEERRLRKLEDMARRYHDYDEAERERNEQQERDRAAAPQPATPAGAMEPGDVPAGETAPTTLEYEPIDALEASEEIAAPAAVDAFDAIEAPATPETAVAREAVEAVETPVVSEAPAESATVEEPAAVEEGADIAAVPAISEEAPADEDGKAPLVFEVVETTEPLKTPESGDDAKGRIKTDAKNSRQSYQFDHRQDFGHYIYALEPNEIATLEFIIDTYGHHHEIFLAPLLRKYTDVLPNLADWERKSILSNLEYKGALRIVRKAAQPYNYAVIVLNHNHPTVRALC